MTAEPSEPSPAVHVAADTGALQRVQALLDAMLAGPFVELRHVGLRVEWASDSAGAFMQFVCGVDVAPHIEVDPDLATAPDAVLRGAIAHELGHAVIALRRGFLGPDLKSRIEADSPDWRWVLRILPGIVANRVHSAGDAQVRRPRQRSPRASWWRRVIDGARAIVVRPIGRLLYNREEFAATRIGIERGFGWDVLEAALHIESKGFDVDPIWGARPARILRLIRRHTTATVPDSVRHLLR